MSYNFYPYEVEPLPYAYDALEPFIDRNTMEIHHDKHYATYANNLNNIIKGYPSLQKYSLEQLLYYDDKMPMEVRIPVTRNAGGCYNHMFFFDGLCKNQVMVNGSLYNAIVKEFGTFEAFKAKFKENALSVFGSGYTWLIVVGNKLKIVNTVNQETVLKMGCPVMCIDVWEHAYYLKHYNMRANYIDDWFSLVDYKKAEQIYQNCINYM